MMIVVNSYSVIQDLCCCFILIDGSGVFFAMYLAIAKERHIFETVEE